ncbi:MAG TPA: hypothetical protein VI259_28300 [Gemmatimonadaceae bacterium]|jgi:hypothetical protein
MATWFALVAVPFLALIDQSVAYATSVWACSHQNTFAVHAVHLSFLIVAITGAIVAAHRWRASAGTAGESDSLARIHFLAGLATGAASLSALAIAAMWAVTWVLRPCVY